MLKEGIHFTSIMQGISSLFSRPKLNTFDENLVTRMNSTMQPSKLQQIFTQKDIDEALAEKHYLEVWIKENYTAVNNALQTIQLSKNNLFVAIGFINSINATLRKAVIITFLQSQGVQR